MFSRIRGMFHRCGCCEPAPCCDSGC
jgi:hypothetical protein